MLGILYIVFYIFKFLFILSFYYSKCYEQCQLDYWPVLGGGGRMKQGYIVRGSLFGEECNRGLAIDRGNVSWEEWHRGILSEGASPGKNGTGDIVRGNLFREEWHRGILSEEECNRGYFPVSLSGGNYPITIPGYTASVTASGKRTYKAQCTH